MFRGLARNFERSIDAAGRRLRAVAITIRGKILLAFCALAAITGLLGFFAVSNVVGAGRLVVRTYDKPLMAISYARLALSKFTEMELTFAQRQATHDPQRRHVLDKRNEELAQGLTESLAVANDRAMSQRAATAGHITARTVARWESLRRRLVAEPGPGTPADRIALGKYAAQVIAAFDNLVEMTAQDGFRDREQALASIATYRTISIAATFCALLLGMIIAMLLARRMVRPIAAASHAARRIAAGELDVEIGSAGSDELGQLLGSMAVMRDNIRGMMQSEIAARRSAQTRLVNAIESSAEGVILVNGGGRILISNSQIATFFPELSGGFAPGAPVPAPLMAALADTTTGEIGLKDGRWLRVGRSPAADGGFVVICSDITAIKERETVLQAAKEQAESASRSKSEFLANMSHELRTPLNAIIGFSEVIRDAMMGPVTVRYRNYARDIGNAGCHLLSLINDVLDLSKVEVGRLELYEEPVHLGEVAVACDRIIGARARAADVELAFEVPNDLPVIRADERRIKQIILNLLSNAVKFTPAGGRIVVSARLTKTGQVAIVVADDGIGIRPEDIPVALEPFRQIDGALNRRYEGTGLGLPLVQRFVELHGGALKIESRPGAGTTVTVLLPAERCIREVA